MKRLLWLLLPVFSVGCAENKLPHDQAGQLAHVEDVSSVGDVGSLPDSHSGFVGAETCARCHAKETEQWKKSPHGLHNVPVAEPEGGADGVVGSHWLQAYIKKDDQGYHRIGPHIFDIREQKWRDTGKVLSEIAGPHQRDLPLSPPLSVRSFERDCSGCHSSGPKLELDPATGNMRSLWRDLAIDCEACHGPGQAHSGAWQRLDPSVPMPRLEKLDARTSIAVCSRCHGGPGAVGDISPADAEHFVAPPALVDQLGYFVDGTAAGQVYQYSAFLRSPCHLIGGLTCSTCHEAHGPGIRQNQTPDAQCTQCHEELASREHTHHHPAGPGARCIECHMPGLLDGLTEHQRDHRISIPQPASPHVPDACTDCHTEESKGWATRAHRVWWGEPDKEKLDAIHGMHLARAGDPDAESLLRKSLDHTDPFFRASASVYLRDPADLLDDPIPEVRMAALTAAIASSDPEAALRRALEDRSPMVRAMAVVELLNRGERVPPELRPDTEMLTKFLPDLEMGAKQTRQLFVANIALGEVYLKQSEPGKALQAFQQAAIFRPRIPAKLNANLGYSIWSRAIQAYEAMGKHEQAKLAHGRCGDLLVISLAETEKPDPEVVARAATSYFHAGQHDKAEALFEQILARLPAGLERDRVEAIRVSYRQRQGGGS